MSSKLQAVRGTHDILPEEFRKFHAVVESARKLARLYGFEEMATPIFEPTEVFSRSMGETSDVVSKEMFTFETRGGESVTLRPEFTAGIARAFIQNGMQQHLPLKLFSTGPLFRYERPQKGRQRQFHQVNFEWLGDGSPEADVETIMLAGHLLLQLGGGEGATLLINTLGDAESRSRYRDALVAYLTPYMNDLSEDSLRRLKINPLRILDSKDPGDRQIVADAPKLMDYVSTEAKARFEHIHEILQQKELPLFKSVRVEPSLVRGLDYYTDTVFEFVADTGELGAQNTVLAGGRYDGLIDQMGGRPTPAVGFAAGVERLLLMMDPNRWTTKPDIKLFLIPDEDVTPGRTHVIATHLRDCLNQIIESRKCRIRASVEILFDGGQKKRLERAHKREGSHVMLLDAEGLKRRECLVRFMKDGTEEHASIGTWEDAKALIDRLLP